LVIKKISLIDLSHFSQYFDIKKHGYEYLNAH
jgi:hypothetical protein